MKIFNIIAIFIYALVFSIIGGIIIALSLRAESLDLIINAMGYLSHENNARLGMALIGLVLIFINISIAQLSIGRLRAHKTIAFENPYGEVTLSLSAIEDHIRKLTNKMPEVKDVKSNVGTVKSGIEVIIRVVLYSDVNIPELTEKIQNMVRLRLQEILGIEETVTVKVHVSKIVSRKKTDGDKHVKEKTERDAFKGEIKYGG